MPTLDDASHLILPAEIMEMIRPGRVPSASEWAPGNLLLPAEESRAFGAFTFEYSPFLRGPLDWLCDPAVQEVTISAPLQSGKTLLGFVWTAWVIKFAPGPFITVMPDNPRLERRMKRLKPTFKANPFLLEKLGGRIENLHVGTGTSLPGMELYLVSAFSEAAASDIPARYIHADEVALWEGLPGELPEDTLQRLRARQTTYEGMSKMLKTSSPKYKGDVFSAEFEDGDHCEYWVPCHNCRYWHFLTWYDKDQPGTHAVMDQDKTGEWLRPRDYEMGGHVRYICPSCGKRWSDYERAAAVQQGQWLPAGVTMGPAGVVQGEIAVTPFKSARIRGLMVHPRLRSIHKMASDWVKAERAKQAKNIGPLKYFLNNHEGIDWEDTRAETDAAKIRTHISSYISGTVPWGVQAIIITVDVHDDWFRLVVIGWDYLFESWQIEVSTIETGDTREVEAFEPLRPLLVKPWPLAGGDLLPPAGMAIDSGYRPEPVKTFCRANRGLIHNGNLIPVLGSPRVMNRTYQKVPIDAELNRFDLNLLALKDQLWRMLFETQTPGGGYMHLPGDITGEIVGELCSEKKVMERGRPQWVPKTESRANHAWDASVYNLFLAQLAGVGRLGPMAEKPPDQKPNPPPKSRREDRPAGFLAGLPKLTR